MGDRSRKAAQDTARPVGIGLLIIVGIVGGGCAFKGSPPLARTQPAPSAVAPSSSIAPVAAAPAIEVIDTHNADRIDRVRGWIPHAGATRFAVDGSLVVDWGNELEVTRLDGSRAVIAGDHAGAAASWRTSEDSDEIAVVRDDSAGRRISIHATDGAVRGVIALDDKTKGRPGSSIEIVHLHKHRLTLLTTSGIVSFDRTKQNAQTLKPNVWETLYTAFSSNGDAFVSTSGSQVDIFALAPSGVREGQGTFTMPPRDDHYPYHPDALALSPDGTTALVSTGRFHAEVAVSIVDITKPIGTKATTTAVKGFTQIGRDPWGRSGKITVTQPNGIAFIDARDLKKIERITLPSFSCAPSSSCDAKKVRWNDLRWIKPGTDDAIPILLGETGDARIVWRVGEPPLITTDKDNFSLSPDGRHVLTLSTTDWRVLRVPDSAQSSQWTTVLSGKWSNYTPYIDEAIKPVVFSPDGKRAAQISGTGWILHDLDAGKIVRRSAPVKYTFDAGLPAALVPEALLRQIAAPVGEMLSRKFLVAEGRFAFFGETAPASAVSVVDLLTGETKWTFDGSRNSDRAIAIEPGGAHVAVGRSSKYTVMPVALHDTATNAIIELGEIDTYGALSFAGNPRRLIVAAPSGEIQGVLSAKDRWTQKGCKSDPRYSRVTKDGSIIVAGREHLCVIDANTGAILAELKAGYDTYGYDALLSPDHTELGWHDSRYGILHRWRLTPPFGEELAPIQFAYQGERATDSASVSWTSNGDRIAVTGLDEVIIFSAADGQAIHRFAVPELRAASIAPNGNTVATLGRFGNATIHSTQDGKPLGRFQCQTSRDMHFLSDRVIGCHVLAQHYFVVRARP